MFEVVGVGGIHSMELKEEAIEKVDEFKTKLDESIQWN